MVQLEEKEIVARQAKERQRGGQGGVLLTPNLGEATDKGETLEILAKDIPLGRESLRKLDVIERNEAKVREAARLRQVQSGKEHGGDRKSLSYRENRLGINRPQADIVEQPEPEKGRTTEILAKQAGVGEA